MNRRLLAAFGTLLVVLPVLIWSRGDRKVERPAIPSLPKAIGAIQPRLSPDGRTVAFAYQGEIWTGPRTGGVMTLLTAGQGVDGEPAWSPDGKRIAYVQGIMVKVVSFPEGKSIPLPGAVSVGGIYPLNKLEFSADGKRLLGGFRTATGNQLAWFDLATGSVAPLLPVSSYFRFALSPDGKWIIHTAMADRVGEQTGNNGSYSDLVKIGSDGKKESEVLCRLPGRVHDLCWADGKSLIMAAELGQPHDDLWKVPLVDSLRGMVKLTSGQADEDRPSVSRDGKWLLYTDNRAGPTALVVRSLVSGEESTIRFDRQDHRRPTGVVRLRVKDVSTGKPVVARVSLREEGGVHRAPPGSLYRTLRGRGHFYCDGSAELSVPAGSYRLSVYRGPEYRVVSREITVKAGEVYQTTVELERWVHMARSGWYSGELHIHANYGYGNWYNTPESMRQQCVGEDLNVCNFMVANSDADVVYDRPYFRGGPDPLSTNEYILYWNQEFRSTIWGHMTLVNLQQLVEPIFTGFQGTTNPWDIPSNADIADRVHWQNGVVNYTHVSQAEDWSKTPYASKAIPIDAALGKVDTLDINKTWAASPVVWYRLLNCGFRIPATAGTDVFLNRIGSNLPGGDRVYVHLGGPLSYRGWIDGLKAGRSFVTNGPMLTFTVNGKEAGTVLKLAETQPRIHVKASARSQYPLQKAELVHNGKVIAIAKLTEDQRSATLDEKITLKEGGWLAFRVEGPGTIDTPVTTLNAHTNPVYVEAAGKTVRSAEEARRFLKWIDQFEIVLRTRNRFPTAKLRQHAQEQIDAARRIYTGILRDAK